MKPTQASFVVACLLLSPMATADVVDSLVPVASASIHDEPRDGVGDAINAGGAVDRLSRSASAEDRIVREYDPSVLLLPNFDEAFASGLIEPGDSLDLGPRTFDFYLYSGNGVAEPSDFEIPATYIGSATYSPPLDSQLFFYVEMTTTVQSLIDGGATHIGLRIEASTDSSAIDQQPELASYLDFSECDPGQFGGFCFGEASCPCGNAGSGFDGCDQSAPGIGGAQLLGTGLASFDSDSFALEVHNLGGVRPGIAIKGDSNVAGGLGVPVGDGLLCVNPQLRSQVVFSNPSGSVAIDNWRGQAFGAYPGAAEVGAPTYYQFWFRDLGNTCSGQGFNFSNGVEIWWF